MLKKRYFLFVLIFLTLLSSCFSQKLKKETLTIKTQNGKEICLVAEMARTEQEMQKGFMERKHIPEGTGMLFVFKTDRIARFWMKNTPTALSIAFIDYKGEIKDIFDMAPYSTSETVSTSYVRYALEVPKGWFEKKGIAKGDTLILDF